MGKVAQIPADAIAAMRCDARLIVETVAKGGTQRECVHAHDEWVGVWMGWVGGCVGV